MAICLILLTKNKYLSVCLSACFPVVLERVGDSEWRRKAKRVWVWGHSLIPAST